MMRTRVSSDKMKYDSRHDILHVFLGNSIDACAEEEYPGIYISRNEDTNRVVGLTIMDYKKQKKRLTDLLPEYDLICNN